MFKFILSFLLLIYPPITTSATPEADLINCYNKNILNYQPIDSYQEPFQCKSDQKKYPGESPPKKGPYAIGKEYPGFEILSIYISSISNAGGSGGHTPPFIAPSKHSFNATIWCEAENTVLGARGLYRIVISGTKQRIPSNLEERTVLQKCSDNIFKTEGK